MAAESLYETLCLVMITTTMILVLIYEEEHRLTSNTYRRRVHAACTILNISLCLNTWLSQTLKFQFNTKDSARCSRNNMLPIIQLSDVISNICTSNTSMTLHTHVISQGKNNLQQQCSCNNPLRKKKMLHASVYFIMNYITI